MAAKQIKIIAEPLSANRTGSPAIGSTSGSTFRGVPLCELEAMIDASAIEELGYSGYDEVPACALLGSIGESTGGNEVLKALAERAIAAFGPSAALQLEDA